MRAGKLRCRIDILKNVSSRNSVLEQIDSWSMPASLWKTVWASIDNLSGSEQLIALQINATSTHKITLRYLTGLTAQMRIRFRNRMLDINHINNVENRNRTLILTCSELN